MNFLPSFSRSMAVFLIPCFFIAGVSAAGMIPRDSLRLELTLSTGSLDTSGNNRILSATGVGPSFVSDPLYNLSYAQFSGNGGLRVNTSWTPVASDDFAVSFWMRLNPGQLDKNISNNSTDLTSMYAPSGEGIMRSIYDKPQVIFSSKNTSSDVNALRFAISKEGKCSMNSNGNTTFPSYANGYLSRLSDTLGTLDSWFDCQSMIDNKWHHFIIQKKTGVVSILIDGKSVFSGTNGLTLTKNLTFGGLGYGGNPSVYAYYPTSVTQDIYNNHWYRGGMLGMRIYSRSLTTSEIEALGDQYRYAQSNLVGTGDMALSIDKYTKPNLTINIKNIPPALSKNTTEYQYSISGSTFNKITTITDLSTSTGSLQYRISLDLSSAKDGLVSISLRTKSGSVYQNIGDISFTKLDTSGAITINQPTTNIANSKTITAFTEANYKLYLYQTRGSICDGTITTWEDYSDITFTSKSDNGIRICYQSIYPETGKITYKLSAAIQGIQSSEDRINSTSSNLFQNYLLWQKSLYPKIDDSTNMVLDLLGAPQRSWTDQLGSNRANTTSIGNGITMIDINGDGLVDFLYGSADPIRRAIIVNNGNYTFKIVYRCAIDVAGTTSTYYGDCADTTR